MKPPVWDDVPRNGCLAACIAAVLERPVGEIPNFVEQHDGMWATRFSAWAETQGFLLLYTYTSRRGSGSSGVMQWPEKTGFPEDYYIAIIAPRSRGKAHAVVMKGSQVVYDPALPPRKRYQKKGMTIIELRPLVKAITITEAYPLVT